MEVFLAKGAGYCFGVKRAMKLANEATDKYGKVNSLGPLIHNPREIARLEDKIKPINSLNELSQDNENKVVIIRTHGVGPEVFKEAEEKGITLIDTTCPFVQKCQQKAALAAREDNHVILVGDRNHPEVNAILRWTDNKAIIVGSLDEAKQIDLPPDSKITIVAQTTLRRQVLDEIVFYIKNKFTTVNVYDTICSATAKRQEQALNLAKEVDAMVIIGGKNSANTQNLAKLCRNHNEHVFLCEGASDLPLDLMQGKKVGVCAGASTPNWIIEEVVLKMTEENVKEEEKDLDEVLDDAKDAAKEAAAAVAAAVKEKLADFKDDVQEKLTDIKEDVQDKIDDIKEERNEEKMEKVIEQLDENDFEKSFEAVLDAQFQHANRGSRVKGVVAQVKDNEVLVDIGGKSEGVLPSAEMVKEEAEDVCGHFKVGQEIEVIILKRENKEGYPVLSKKRVDQELAWEKLEQIKENDEVITGKVVEVVKGGVLVDVGVRGFVPTSLIGLGFVEDLNSLIGKELTMKVIECKKQGNKLVLSPKAVIVEEAEKQREATWASLAPDQVRKGIVRRLTTFGAFIDLGGVDGLLHVSEMAWYRVNKPSDILKEGQEIEVYVISVDQETGKISLGLKQLTQDPWAAAVEKYPVGSIIPVTIMRTATFGAFAQVEPGMEGLIHISQLSRSRVEKTEDAVKAGDVVNVKVVALDPEAKRISLSIRETLPELPKEEAEEVTPVEEEVVEATEEVQE